MAEPGDPPVPEDPTLDGVIADASTAHAEVESDDAPAAPEPEAPVATTPEPQDDWDDLVGFTSSAAIQGRQREVLTITDVPADALSVPDEASRTADSPAKSDLKSADPVPAWAIETPLSARHVSEKPRKTFGRTSTPQPVEGSMWAYTIYAMILFAVPTLGVSALIGLLAVTGRSAPEQAVARSHYIYQQRTLWAAAVAALLGLILIVVNLGVFVLFLLALWTLVRGAAGVLKLKAGLPIAEPRSWFI